VLDRFQVRALISSMARNAHENRQVSFELLLSVLSVDFRNEPCSASLLEAF
jgi:hypothetical protein